MSLPLSLPLPLSPTGCHVLAMVMQFLTMVWKWKSVEELMAVSKKELKQPTWTQYIIITRYLHAWIPRLPVASFITYALVPKLRYVDAEI